MSTEEWELPSGIQQTESHGGHSETSCRLSTWVGESERGEARPWRLEVYSRWEFDKERQQDEHGGQKESRGKPRFVATVNYQAGVLPLLPEEAMARRSQSQSVFPFLGLTPKLSHGWGSRVFPWLLLYCYLVNMGYLSTTWMAVRLSQESTLSLFCLRRLNKKRHKQHIERIGNWLISNVTLSKSN